MDRRNAPALPCPEIDVDRKAHNGHGERAGMVLRGVPPVSLLFSPVSPPDRVARRDEGISPGGAWKWA